MTKLDFSSLTPLEICALRSAFKSSKGNGHDFGYTDDIKVDGMSRQVVGALITNLLLKGIITRDYEYGQFCFGLDWTTDRYAQAEAVATFLFSPKPAIR